MVGGGVLGAGGIHVELCAVELPELCDVDTPVTGCCSLKIGGAPIDDGGTLYVFFVDSSRVGGGAFGFVTFGVCGCTSGLCSPIFELFELSPPDLDSFETSSKS